MADLFDIVVARKLSGGGGGGSSDLSAATITLVGTALSITSPRIFTAEESGAPFDYLVADAAEFIADTTINVALYKGNSIIYVFPEKGKTINTSGNIEYLGEIGDGMYLVTGDCTITIS